MTEPQPGTLVPKFGSFRPKTIAPAPPDQVDESRKTERKANTKYESTIPAGRKHQHHHRHHQSKGEETSHKSSSDAVPHARNETPNQTFIVDRKGDVNNLIYGGIHRYSIPPFQRSGGGRVLGAPKTLKIDRTHGDEKGLVLNSRNHTMSHSREKYVFSKIERRKPRLLRIHRELQVEPSIERHLDFISLQTTREKKRERGEGIDGSESEPDGTHYRSIHGRVMDNDQPEDIELEYATESDSSRSDTGTMKLDLLTKQKTVDLSRRVEQCPDDINAWLALIEHQDTLIRARHDDRQPTSAEIRSTADIKISMFEKALERVTSLPDRERLLLGLMNEGSKILEASLQSEKWEEISKEHIDSLLLWKSYINFRQTTFLTFRFDEVRLIFLKRIKLLLATLTSAELSRAIPLYEQTLYVILRFTIYARESGYVEFGVAIWQGLLEYNLRSPPLLDHGIQKVALFKRFWESEVPRIGESGSAGWGRFVTDQDSSLSAIPDPLVVNSESPLDLEHIFSGWAKVERLKSNSSRIPARTTDDVAEDDPFQVVLASDIEDFLISIPRDSISLRRSLIDAFLVFCQLPPIGNGCVQNSDLWAYNTFTKRDLLGRDSLSAATEGSSSEYDFNKDSGLDVTSLFGNSASRFVSSSESMFGHCWFQRLGNWQTDYASGNEPVSYKWVRRALQQLTQTCFDEDLGEYYLAFESKNEPGSIKKLSRALLKQHPASLRLYNSYGLIEWSKGNRDVANSVFSVALQMSRSGTENDSKDSIILRKSWVWSLLEAMDNDTALRCLVSVSEDTTNVVSSVTPAVLLKAKQSLQSTRDYLLSSGDTNHAVIYAECLALLEYLSSKSVYETQSTKQGDIITALSTFENFSQLLVSRKLTSSDPHEYLLQSAARLLYHHGRIGPYRPALFRHHLSNFLSLYPQNTIFLSLYMVNESRVRVDNRVRSILTSTILTPGNDSPTSRLFAIRYEIAFGTIHSARSAFEHALASPVSKLAVGLWKFYINYCLRTSRFHSQVKDVWHRALRACPWAKELYILGFEILEGIVSFEDLKRTWRVMGEKELRVHVDLEDRFDEIGELEQRDQGSTRIRKLCIK